MAEILLKVTLNTMILILNLAYNLAIYVLIIEILINVKYWLIVV
jgi:hypothetical protein